MKKLYNKVTPGDNNNILTSDKGTSGPTFQGVTRHCKLNRPKVVVLENVPAVGKPEIVCKLWEAFAELGYYGAKRTVKSIKFSLPQSRERVFFVLMDAAAWSMEVSECEALCEAILADVELFKMDTMALTDFLLPSDLDF